MSNLTSSLIDEQSVLAQCFIDPEIVPYIIYGMKDWYFSDPLYQTVFKAIKRIEEDHGRQEQVDAATVYNRILTSPDIQSPALSITDILAIYNGITHMPETAPALTQAIGRIRESARLRYLNKLAQKLTQRIENGEGDAATIKGWFEESVERLTIETDNENNEGFTILGDMADDMEQMYIEFQEGKITALDTPFPRLNAILGFGGLMPNDLVILAAHTSFGKSTMALYLAKHVIDQGGDVGMFSLEMSKESLFMKLHSNVADFDSAKIRPLMSEAELHTLLSTLDQMRGMRLFVDTRTTDLYELRAKAKRLKKRNKNLKLLIVDYLQLIGTSNSKQGEKERIVEVSRMLKLLAQELEIPIIALSQFSRESYKADTEPKLSDLYGAGAIEKDADHVWFLHGEKPTHGISIRMLTFIVAKQRKNGGLGRVSLIFNAKTGDFVENSDVALAEDGTEIAYRNSDNGE